MDALLIVKEIAVLQTVWFLVSSFYEQSNSGLAPTIYTDDEVLHMVNYNHLLKLHSLTLLSQDIQRILKSRLKMEWPRETAILAHITSDEASLRTTLDELKELVSSRVHNLALDLKAYDEKTEPLEIEGAMDTGSPEEHFVDSESVLVPEESEPLTPEPLSPVLEASQSDVLSETHMPVEFAESVTSPLADPETKREEAKVDEEEGEEEEDEKDGEEDKAKVDEVAEDEVAEDEEIGRNEEGEIQNEAEAMEDIEIKGEEITVPVINETISEATENILDGETQVEVKEEANNTEKSKPVGLVDEHKSEAEIETGSQETIPNSVEDSQDVKEELDDRKERVTFEADTPEEATTASQFNARKRKSMTPPAQSNKRFQSMVNQLITDISGNKYATMFLQPVSENDAPDYYSLIRSPIDLKILKQMVKKQEITNFVEFERSLRLMFANAIMYNHEDTETYLWTLQMIKDVDMMLNLFKSAQRDG
ncbi:hypothetical protein BABINDRAFT_163343 [Babjeviella inositovora NRRL Y-12698]|uniref:Bromo domain-containing protein n=1 Tax=Babjeviella inositovora NRRL Y-12698 TaxID=984486 RepID=A0A1E3QIZ5_9ASCO|nr:uncharacterized protein BABINDRAFT_163343 [Babjeviella inositovora NRRL Y-12698]ODQ77620.1 hypothetical protein BABINDRAFT_163343 [Babjeviella inositovora NRRL Y-12698]